MGAPVTGKPIKIVVVDDHRLVREGIRVMLEAEDDFSVVAEAGDSEAAVAAVARERPHVILLDVEIPGDVVTTTVRRMRSVSPGSAVIILTIHDGPRLVQTLLNSGVRGYLLKSVSRQELVAAVRSATAGDGRIVLSVSPSTFPRAAPEARLLSPRERMVLQLVADALSNLQVATRLGLTEATVKRHLRNIFVKLGAVSRIDAVNKAVATSLIQPQQVAEDGDLPGSFRPGGDGLLGGDP